ncbi:Hypothetical protein HVPorG_03821a (plasmid) [Roseomonas mucosa]|jgi:hypothetical protein|uniref:Uncharacterized protein n=1 Tax=Roseomonas mucosa TaxID=207340 RepID=A0A1S8D2F6_9PROT|nr:hypothetical protein [Roseomonas mucosa]PZR07618.1 MAG: hypothetical protein DI532_23370 [Azospirillum brasilense]ONH81788.1 hypothetical protein APZ41_018035 [Roseomonas mucosa]QDD97367.1 Hypothetical protein ADP8_03821 [Roseomonas mucosa]QDJ12150.1 Hypothetical protein HVPorG_03821a [Roseomonas mucosa]QET91402.1 hypothetical protein FOB66_00155 [Roseomonas mucosa]
MPVAGEASAPAGAVYDGDGRLVLGSGPAFSLGLITDRAFQAVLHNLDEPGDTIEPEDRLWLLPEGLIPDAPLHVLASLAAVVRAGRKVVVMADSAEAGNRACEAIGQALDARQGSA